MNACPEVYRKQLAEAADHIGAAISEAARRPSPERLELLAVQLTGAYRLTMQFRGALLAELEGAPNDAA